MTRQETVQRKIRRLLASTAGAPAWKRMRVELPPKRRREAEAKRRARALRNYTETKGTDALNRRYPGSDGPVKDR